MASAFAHAVAAMSIATLAGIPISRWRMVFLGMACAVMPDLDAIGFWLGIPYAHPLGHRGASHSLVFAALTAWAVMQWGVATQTGAERYRVGVHAFLATASHGLLDAMTTGGLGVAFFWPLDSTRYFFPFRPIEVSPLELDQFFGARGWVVLKSEFVWVGIPALMVMAGSGVLWRRLRDRQRKPAGPASCDQ